MLRDRRTAGVHRAKAMGLISGVVMALFVSACGSGPAATQPSPSSAAFPGATATEPAATPGASASQAAGGPLTDVEIATLTLGMLVAVPPTALGPKVDAAAAEAAVRAKYPGARTTIGIQRVAMQLTAGLRVGWLVALTPAAGAPCNLHAGLLPRAIEGGIVDDQTGDVFWEFVCG